MRAAASFGLIVVIAVFFADPSRFALWFRSRVRWVANWLGDEAGAAGWSWLGPNDFVARRPFAIGCVIYGAGWLTIALAPNLLVLIVGSSVLEGVGAALIMPAIVALVALNFPREGPSVAGPAMTGR